MFRPLHALLPLAVLGIGAGACASDDTNGYQSGVDGSLDLGNLTPAQQVTICESQAAYVHAHVDTTSLTRFLCAFSPAVLTAADDAACETAMTTCVNAFSVKLDVTATGPDATAAACHLVPVSSCTGSVATYQNCVQSLTDVQIQIGTDWSCGKRGQYADGPTVGVSACQALGPSCTSASQPQLLH